MLVGSIRKACRPSLQLGVDQVNLTQIGQRLSVPQARNRPARVRVALNVEARQQTNLRLAGLAERWL